MGYVGEDRKAIVDVGGGLYKEESRIGKRLSEPQHKALQQLKKLIQEVLDIYELGYIRGEVTMWGVPILGDERSDLVILRFLKAKNLEAWDAFAMIKNALLWRQGVCIESLLEQDLGNDYEKVMFTNGHDKEGYPVWYLVLEECLNDPSISSNVENQRKLLRWLIQFVEKNIRKLNFSLTSINSFHLVIDLQNITYYEYRNVYKVIYKFLKLLTDNYPEFVAKQLWINASWWYRTYCRVYSAVFDGWSTNKIVFSGSSKTIDTLFRQVEMWLPFFLFAKYMSLCSLFPNPFVDWVHFNAKNRYISPEQVPVRFGGLSRDDKQACCQFTSNEPVSEVTIKPASKHTAEFSFAEECDVIWELRVIGWDVCYEAEFLPSTKGRYITNISRHKKIAPNDEPVISDNFRVIEPGKLALTIDNTSSKKKKLLVRVRAMTFDLNMEDGPSLRGWLLLSDES
ncbi:hypothetical protein Cgig2_022224 [Carnegiea gigantea]|uniref:Patellin-4 n=1 Tax=Carnegiea gigantea TaxID=171969 RepID=A0A9Q1QHK9_9CARY|nr:hypothetical protein Cgig2_022224 [Carnegiea gigantea]